MWFIYIVHIVLCESYHIFYLMVVIHYLFICARYTLLLFIYFVHVRSHLSIVRLLFFVHCSKEKNSILILECVSGISILCTTSSMRVNKHHTADCTDFVLVWEKRTYYDHRDSGIDETKTYSPKKSQQLRTRQYLAEISIENKWFWRGGLSD